MNDEPIYFQGEPLPPLRPGKVWGFKIWPGGRMELRPVPPGMIDSVGYALNRLEAGHAATVALSDATETAKQATIIRLRKMRT